MGCCRKSASATPSSARSLLSACIEPSRRAFMQLFSPPSPTPRRLFLRAANKNVIEFSLGSGPCARGQAGATPRGRATAGTTTGAAVAHTHAHRGGGGSAGGDVHAFWSQPLPCSASLSCSESK